MNLSEGQIISSRYEIIEVIGNGGMSVVYRAKDLKLDRDVTFKALNDAGAEDDGSDAKVMNEARAVAKLNHANIVNIYDVGEENGVKYIIMEYVDGLTLKKLIESSAPFGNVEINNVTLQIALAPVLITTDILEPAATISLPASIFCAVICP
ncbi:hypothetical protein FACS189490_08430 [Clostridia bacterium]|nr:hypothetical protein FACS189490_08430 [Clostridia bacterium]